MAVGALKKIVIVTTSQPASNPRAVKEATCLAEAGFLVTFVYTVTLSWGDAIDAKIINSNPAIHWIQAGKSVPQHKWYYRYVRARRKLYEKGYRAGFKNFCADYAAVLFGQELYKKAKKLNPDLIIAHNLGALPAAAKLAALFKKPYAFDAEDFHRGEGPADSFHWQFSKFLEDRYFNGLAYLTASSPLICDAYKKLYPNIQVHTVLNVFPVSYLQKPQTEPGIQQPLKLFWFSQTIGRQRGLEDIIVAMGRLKDHKIRLTLLGNLKPWDKAYFDALIGLQPVPAENIVFLEPVDENEIPVIAADHDLGLALEPPYCESRDLCLTNKLFIYLMSGNAVLFSETRAQKLFLLSNPGIGMIYKSGDVDALVDLLFFCIQEKKQVTEMRTKSLGYAAASYNWEEEKKKLQPIVNAQMLKNN